MKTGWKTDGANGVFELGNHRLSFDMAQPQIGLSYACNSVERTRALQIEFPGNLARESVLECYARPNDLVVTYNQASSRTVSPQICIRVDEAADDMVVQLIISMQTDLLECVPATSVASVFERGELLLRVDDGWRTAEQSDGSTIAFLHRPSDADYSFFQLLHPSDLSSSSHGTNPLRAEFRLFGESLEKGVIRRARIAAGWIGRDADLVTAERYVQQLAAESPPLTT
jgi:hypothetical protein